MNILQPLPSEQLYRHCNPNQFEFTTTAELQDGEEIIGQDRALAAIQFGIRMPHDGFNLFVLGPHGTGKYTAVRQFLEKRAALEPVPDDWCYVYNFKQPHKPQALRLPAGRAVHLRVAMQKMIEELFTVLPAAFTSDEYQAQRKVLEQEYKNHQTQALEDLREQAKQHNIALMQTPNGFAFAPLKNDQVVSPDEFLHFSADEQQEIETHVLALQDSLQVIMQQLPHWQRDVQQKLKLLNSDVADFAIGPLFAELQETYAELPAVLTYLAAMRVDVVENVNAFLEDKEEPMLQVALGIASAEPVRIQTRYQINVVIDNHDLQGAPVVDEDQPRYPNLVGRVEHVSQMGALLTDFTLIKSGALHLANGGYLVLDARKLLSQPYAWDGLKHALRKREIRIESLGQAYSLVSTVSLEPEPIPLDVKVILVGERHLYYLLCQYEPDFSELFKVSADFEDHMPRTLENNLAYAQLIAALVRKEGLHHFKHTAVARIIEHSSREAGDAEKLSVHMQTMSDLMREANYWAGENGHDLIDVADVERALAAQKYRRSRISDHLQEDILRETLLIDTSGAVVGQVNGLAVYATGQMMFGKPSRITARVRMGKGEVIDIERQVELGGALHSKGVMILAGFLGARFAAERPFPLSATLVFEQSYAGVDGDSASSAELYALLSALAVVPLKQSLAVTGSVNQLGQIQAIGGVNEKIEGFFEVCQARGLSGEQGVLIPQANVKHLMLHKDVVTAVTAGKFHIYPVTTVDEGIERLTGTAAGALDAAGKYPDDSVNGRIMARLTHWIATQRAFAASPKPERN